MPPLQPSKSKLHIHSILIWNAIKVLLLEVHSPLKEMLVTSCISGGGNRIGPMTACPCLTNFDQDFVNPYQLTLIVIHTIF